MSTTTPAPPTPAASSPPMPEPRATWRRRATVMAAVGLAVGLGFVLLARDSDDGPAPMTGEPSLPRLNPAATDTRLDIRYRVPEGWRYRRRDGVVRLIGEGREAGVTITAPTAAGRARQVLTDTLAVIRANYSRVEVSGRVPGRRLGGLRARSALVAARNAKGEDLRILAAAASGKERTYLVQFFQFEKGATERVVEAQLVLRSLELRG